MSTHTPGPWKVESSNADDCGLGGFMILGPSDCYIASLSNEDGQASKEDAALIASAPAMLEALKLAQFALLSMPDDVKAHLPGNVLPAMQQAIRLAEGRP